MKEIAQARRVVIKIGTSTLTHDTGRIHIRRFEHLCKVLCDLQNAGRELILVSSGAVGVGVGKLGLASRPTDTPGKQAAAAVGQCELMYLYDEQFLGKSHKVAQVLLTRDGFEIEARRQNMKNTLNRLLELGAIPIVNENDTVAIEELEFGDNDNLSAQVAVLMEADLLIILSDIDGLFDSNPRTNPAASLISTVSVIDEYIESIAGGSDSGLGTGGMSTKIQAARLATENGIALAILNGQHPELLYDLFDGKGPGTLFLPKE